MKTTLLIVLTIALSGCGAQKLNDGTSSVSTQWDQSAALRARKAVTCVPQAVSKTLVANNNFYSYRDGRQYLDLDGSTGTFRRLTIAEGKDGQRVVTRLQGCFFVRSDATNGDQLLLDTTYAISDQYFDPMEVFTYTLTGSAMNMVRFDDSQLWSYQECPTLDTPDNFCSILRNGNVMYFPNLNPAQKSATLAEAISIRRTFNNDLISRATFNGVWAQGGKVAMREDYKFAVQAIVDTPRYIDQAWFSYLRHQSNLMPDLTSNTVPPLCYSGSQTITYPNGTTGKVYGQVCYVDGDYTFQ